MRNRWKRGAVRLLVPGITGIALVFFFARPDDEPRYKGRPLSYWVGPPADLTKHPNVADPKAIEAIGTNALPYLVKWATYTTPQWQATLGDLAIKFGLSQERYRRLTYVKREFRANAALGALIQLRDEASPTIAELAHIAVHSSSTNTITRARNCLYTLLFNSQYRVVFATGRLETNPHASSMLAAALLDTHPVVREEATNVLTSFSLGYNCSIRLAP